MNLKIKTYVLQNMLNKAVKGASMNKMIPLTNLMSIRVADKVITIETTDATNYLYVSDTIDSEGELNVVVMADIFCKLISKLTSEYVELSVDDDILTVIGNGKYKIELPLDDEGSLVKYPDPIKKFDSTYSFAIKRDDIQKVLATAKASLSTSTDAICYTGYYISDKIVTTDTEVMCGINRDIGFSTNPVIIFPSTMDLLDLMSDTQIQCSYDDNRSIVFTTKNCSVYGKVMDCVDDFQIDEISGLLEQDFDSTCTVKRQELLNVLDRVSLFVGAYDKNCVYLTFTDDGLNVQSMQTNSSETLNYASVINFKSFTCCIDVEMLKSQIKAYTSDSVDIQYGRDNAIKLVDGDTVQIVCLQEDNR